MKVMHVGELKAKFSMILDLLRQGEEIVVAFGRKNENVAVLVPYDEYRQRNVIKLGNLADKATCKIKKDFALDDDYLIGE
ncbi:MAG: type II toxin-antitoxin system prevent-host-death family antitoxin [Candidatus Riflebacteria bacterium HGW-Riflebacteria-1]|jgi:antitoxin (DNA-binding transcriptional repressor) of toxin-antitoxin stability system|nr:MAG: type II toxin-antitoxin system prevent-host-death family antitoxin [Candidatus Riflebacteria bacterium HGW-Riflebacteria-1]